MIFEPVNSVTDLDFYKKVSAQPLLRSMGYLCYMAIVFAVLSTFALKLKMGPVINQSFQWLEREMPTLSYADGKITSSVPGPKRIQHPNIPEIALMIDTTRTEPVGFEQMKEANVMAYLTQGAFYMRESRDGGIRPYDFSKSGAGTRPVTIDAAFVHNANVVMNRVLYPVALAVAFVIVIAWKLAASLIYSLLALLLNAAAKAPLAFGALFSVSVYAQTLAMVFLAASLFLPFPIPGLSLIAFAMTGTYIWLALKRHSSPVSV